MNNKEQREEGRRYETQLLYEIYMLFKTEHYVKQHIEYFSQPESNSLKNCESGASEKFQNEEVRRRLFCIINQLQNYFGDFE